MLPLSAQSDVNRKAADQFKLDFNNGNFENIYNSFSPEMQKARTKEYLFNFLLKVKTENGMLQSLSLYEYRQSRKKYRGVYDGHFENETLTVTITTSPIGQITGLYIRKKTLL